MSEEVEEVKSYKFSEGNQWWQARSTHGRKPLWDNPQELLEACEEYFDWAVKNPLWETQPKVLNGEIVDHAVDRLRAMTVSGLCVFLGITRETWNQYRKKSDFSDICEHVDQVMFTQKVSGAAAGLLKENIIARETGLADKKEAKNELTGANGAPIEIDHDYQITFNPVRSD